MQLWAKTFIGIILGIVTGIIVGPAACFFKPLGDIFLRLLSCLIVPLVFSSIVSGITSVPSGSQLGRIGARTLFLYLFTTIFAIMLGLFIAMVFPIGTLLNLASFLPESSPALAQPIDIQNIITSLIPSNPFKAVYEQNLLQVMLMSLFFGIGINACQKKCTQLKDWVDALSQVMQKLALMIMSFSPIAVFALMASSIGTMGWTTLLPLFYFLLLYYGAAMLHIAIIHCGSLTFLAKLKPRHFFSGMKDTFATTISTCSSSASLPMCIDSVTKMGVSKPFAHFVLPLCSTLNMNGSALYQMMAALFISQALGITLTFNDILTLMGAVFLATMGTAHIPGGGFIMLSVVFSSIGLPLESLALLAGIDRLRDMATTTLNISGDALCTILVAKKEGELDETMYYKTAPAVA